MDRIDPREIAEQLRQFQVDVRFIQDHMAELLSKHPLQWVAVFEEKIVAVGGTLEEVVRRVEESGAPRGRIALKFLDPDPKPLVLAVAW